MKYININIAIFLVFLILKLSNIITWSWWLITLPLWIGLPILAFFTIVVIIFLAIKDK